MNLSLRNVLVLILSTLALAVAACDNDSDPDEGLGDAEAVYSVASIVQGPEGRTLYLWATEDLEHDLKIGSAIEIPGNSRHWSYNGAVYAGLNQEPTIRKLVLDDGGRLVDGGSVSFLARGLANIPAGVAFLSPTKAYLFSEAQYEVVIWNPTTMEITGSIDLSSLKKEAYSVEMHMAVVSGDRVFVPLRYLDYTNQKAIEEAAVMIFDAPTDRLVNVARSDRCIGAERPAIAADGTAYVLSDGRSFLVQSWARNAGEPMPHNCILRIRPGAENFDPDFFVDLPELTGGPDAATALWESGKDGVAFAKLFDASQLPSNADDSSFNIWSYPAYGLWRFELGDTVTATQVANAPYSIIDFGGTTVDGQFYIGLTPDGVSSPVYQVDPSTGEAHKAFQLDGQLREIYRLR